MAYHFNDAADQFLVIFQAIKVNESEIIMKENILKLLKDESNFYPANLEQKFPLILDKIIELWNSPEFDNHLNTLMLDKRDHYRQGFPPEVAAEILRFSSLHSKQFGTGQASLWIAPSNIRVN